MQSESIQAMATSSHAAFGELVHSLATQVSEVKNLCALRPVAGGAGVDLKAMNQRVVAAEAAMLEMKAFVQEEEDSLVRLQVREACVRLNCHHDHLSCKSCPGACCCSLMLRIVTHKGGHGICVVYRAVAPAADAAGVHRQHARAERAHRLFEEEHPVQLAECCSRVAVTTWPRRRPSLMDVNVINFFKPSLLDHAARTHARAHLPLITATTPVARTKPLP